MQNSGLGNAVNPLTSLVDPEVYSVPLLLIVGWRGAPGIKDEPQHVKQGRITLSILETLEIPYSIVNAESEVASLVAVAVRTAVERGSAYALVVEKGTFESYETRNEIRSDFPHSRETALKQVLERLGHRDVVVSTTGMASREVFEYRSSCGQGHERDFLTVGGMGHASQIALGVARQRPDVTVVCLDGDGAAIMHLGALAIIGASPVGNLKHVVLNNGAHDSVGGQPTVGLKIDLPAVAKGLGYAFADSCESSAQIQSGLDGLFSAKGPALLEIKVRKGNRADLGRPSIAPMESKDAYMKFLATT
jgi:phosphonopyruvate decarboxylase